MSETEGTTWTPKGFMTAEVTFEEGKGDRYAKVALDGHPVGPLTSAHSPGEVFDYLGKGTRGSYWLPDFGRDLLMVFHKENRARFEAVASRSAATADDRLLVFRFEIKQRGLFTMDNLAPGIIAGDSGVFTGLEGLLWINSEDMSLRRLVVHYSEIDPKFPTKAAGIATDYGWVTISDLGKFLLPTGGELIDCGNGGRCWRNVSTFSNCHKYAAKSRMIPIH